MASAFPTAGGLYHWASILGGRFWGWLTAWLNLLGLITVLGAINIGTAYFLAGTFGAMFGFGGTDMQVVTFVAAITIVQALFNHLGIKVTTMLTDITAYLFLLCLLLPVYTITGYDASAHTSEETKSAATSVPAGIVSAVFWSSLVGWIMICAITLAIPDLAVAAGQGWGMVFCPMGAN